jgi:uncharacterized protein (TIGR03435 family)
VASVKPSPPIVGEHVCGPPRVDPVVLSFSGCTLKVLMTWAYDLKYNPIDGGPNWIDSLDNRYDVEARAESTASVDQMRMMLRALLADRFQLKAHLEKKERPSLALVVTKSGSKLKEVTPGEALHGQIRFGMSGKAMMLTGEKAPLDELTRWLTSILNFGGAVADETGLKGAYDFKLEWLPEDDLPSAALFEAVQRQLGLKLEERKAPIEVLVIEHVEKALPNP